MKKPKKIKRTFAAFLALVFILAAFPATPISGTSLTYDIGFETSAVNNNSVSFRWDAQSGAQSWNYNTKRATSVSDAYYIERAETPDAEEDEFFRIGSVRAWQQMTFTDNANTLVPGGTYYYRIAFMVDNEVRYSNTLAVTLLSVNTEDFNFRMARITRDGAELRWEAAVPNVVTWNYATRHTGGRDRYHIERAESLDGPFSQIGRTDNELTFTDISSGFFAGGTYYYRLSVMVNTTIFSSEPIQVTLPRVFVPGFEVVTVGESSITFRWDAVTNAQGWNYDTKRVSSVSDAYYIERAETPDGEEGEFFRIGSVRARQNMTFTVNNVPAGTTYYYRVAAMVNGTIITSEPIPVGIGVDDPEPEPVKVTIANTPVIFDDDNSSGWARPELEEAEKLGIIPESLREPGVDFRKPITRAEFAGVVVKTFEQLSNIPALPSIINPFTDTNDTYVLRAYNAGIMIGMSPTEFEPDTLLNREQAATAITRSFKRAVIPGWTLPADADYPLNFEWPAPFADDERISGWARESVYFMASNEIIRGFEDGTFRPNNETERQRAIGYALNTREQALIIALRLIKNLG